MEDIEIEEPQEVIIIFLGPTEDKKLYKLAEKGGSFDFLNASEEDIYSDFLNINMLFVIMVMINEYRSKALEIKTKGA